MPRVVRMIATMSAVLGLILAPIAPTAAAGCGTVVHEELNGPTLNAVVPRGQASADESQFLCGGSTTLTVDVADVNLPDGTVLDVRLDFLPVGKITLSRMAGGMAADLGRFAVSNDSVRVIHQGKLILIGAFFR